MSVRIDTEPIIRLNGHWWERRWHWLVFATRDGTYLDAPDGFTWTRRGAQIARARAADRLRQQHGGDA